MKVGGKGRRKREKRRTQKNFLHREGASSLFALFPSLTLSLRKTLPTVQHLGLSAPYKAYKNRYCLDTHAQDYQHTLHRHRSYSELACYRDCVLDVIVAQCNCTSPFEPGRCRVSPLHPNKVGQFHLHTSKVVLYLFFHLKKNY